MSVEAWFPTLIYNSPLQQQGLAQFNAELLKECYQVRDFDAEGQRWSRKSYPGGYTSYGTMCHLNEFSSTFAELEKKIRRHVLKFTARLDMNLAGKKVRMTDCWVNIMPNRVNHSLHLHPLSFISGTYYVRTPAKCSAIKFEDPRLASFMAAPPKTPGARRENQQFVAYPAKAGHLILFESWLRHEVPANASSSDRVSISFNYDWT